MDIKIFVKSLSLDEKRKIYDELKNEVQKLTVSEWFEYQNANNGMSIRLYNVLKSSMPRIKDMSLDELNLKFMELRNSGKKCHEEFRKLAGF